MNTDIFLPRRGLASMPGLAPPPLPKKPRVLIGSSSGGNDSTAAMIVARLLWPTVPMILWHAHLDEMDWPQTGAVLDEIAAHIGNCTIVKVQAVYATTGKLTPTGMNASTLSLIHDVAAHGPYQVHDPTREAATLLQFARLMRHGQPPTTSIRWCTEYFKSRLFESWVIPRRAELSNAILITGERWAESPARAKKPPWEHRLTLKPGHKDYPQGWTMIWLRPVIDWFWHEVNQVVFDAGLPFHPGYAIQGETLDAMLDPTRDERKGRARLSCMRCIYTRAANIAAATRNAPEIMGPANAAIDAYEQETGYHWSPKGFTATLLKGHD